MCDPATIAVGIKIASVVATRAAAMWAVDAAGRAIAGAGEAPEPGAPAKPPQATKLPDEPARRASQAAARAAMPGGATGTMLTGPGGIAASGLNLGKNVLLGS